MLDYHWHVYFRDYHREHRKAPNKYNVQHIIYQATRANLGRPCVGMDLLIYEEDIPCTGFCQVHVRFTGYDLAYTPEQITTMEVKAAAIEANRIKREGIKENLAPIVVVQEASSSGTSEIPRWRRREPQTWSFPSNMDPDARRALLSDKRITQQITEADRKPHSA